MPQLLVVGSVAFDTIETPFGKREKILGGSANYFSLSASFFSPIQMVAVVGEDFPMAHLEHLQSRGVDVEGVQRVEGETFHWIGRYGDDLNQAHTLETHLNVFENFKPELPASYRETQTIFLANIDPDLQLEVLDQVENPRLVACDTMNYWIFGKRNALLKVLERVNVFLSNEQEVRDLSGEKNLLAAVNWIQERGPSVVVVKRGEYGAMLFTKADNEIFWAPAFPLEFVKDPTGAGDSFAGGMLGVLANAAELSPEVLRRAVVAGTVMASYNVEQFSCDRLMSLAQEEIAARYQAMHKMMAFAPDALPFTGR